MATLHAGGIALNMVTADIGGALTGADEIVQDSTVWSLIDKSGDEILGINSLMGTSLGYDGAGVPVSGEFSSWINDIYLPGGGVAGWVAYEFAVAAHPVGIAFQTDNPKSLFQMILSGNDTIAGSEFNDVLFGFDGSDTILGQKGGDRIFGGSGNDTISGGWGNDKISGGSGNDSLEGGAAADQFIFDARPLARNADVIEDFAPGTDKIVLDSDIFTSLQAGALDPADFRLGGFATSADHHVIYESATGRIFYDVDGKGGEARQLVVTVDAGLVLGVSDFLIV